MSRSRFIFLLNAGFSLMACNKDDNKKGVSAGLPHVTPPVKAAAPSGLQTALTSSAVEGLAGRFFNADGGPSNIFNLLANIDHSIDDINRITAADEKPCRTQAAVAYDIHPAGETVTMYAQCFQTLAAGAVSTTAGLNQYGIKDGVIYLYSYAANGQSAVIVTPITGSTGNYTVKAWFSLSTGTGDTWDVGSYGLMNLVANSEKKTFEFAIAGLNLGYCGAQLKSDGSDLYASVSMEAGAACDAKVDVCAKAIDLSDNATCADGVKLFELTPIGHKSVTGSSTRAASLYPATPNITFDGTGADDLHFGPSEAVAGVGSLDGSAGK